MRYSTAKVVVVLAFLSITAITLVLGDKKIKATLKIDNSSLKLVIPSVPRKIPRNLKIYPKNDNQFHSCEEDHELLVPHPHTATTLQFGFGNNGGGGFNNGFGGFNNGFGGFNNGFGGPNNNAFDNGFGNDNGFGGFGNNNRFGPDRGFGSGPGGFGGGPGGFGGGPGGFGGGPGGFGGGPFGNRGNFGSLFDEVFGSLGFGNRNNNNNNHHNANNGFNRHNGHSHDEIAHRRDEMFNNGTTTVTEVPIGSAPRVDFGFDDVNLNARPVNPNNAHSGGAFNNNNNGRLF